MTVSPADKKSRPAGAIAISGEVVRVAVTGIDVTGRVFRDAATVLMLDRCDCVIRTRFQPILDSSLLAVFDYPRADPELRISQGRVLLNDSEMSSGYFQVVMALQFPQLVKVTADLRESQTIIQKLDPPPVAKILERPVTQSKVRRSERVVIQIPVIVFGQNANGHMFEEKTSTMTVNAHGALVALKTEIHLQKPLLLVHARTQSEVQCRVVHRKEIDPGRLEVGMEFASSLPSFWGINFPPEDWTPADR